MANSQKESNSRPYRAFGMASAMGTELLGCVLGGLYLGKWLDMKWGTLPWLMVSGVLLGLTAGIIGIVQLAKAFNKPESPSSK